MIMLKYSLLHDAVGSAMRVFGSRENVAEQRILATTNDIHFYYHTQMGFKVISHFLIT